MQSTTLFQQLSLEEMQHGLAKPIARLGLEPSDISARVGLRFVPAQDDLDDLEVALIRTCSGRQLAFVRHRNQPSPGTDVIGNERSEDSTADLIEGMKILALSSDDLTWMHPEIDQRRVLLAKQPDPSAAGSEFR